MARLKQLTDNITREVYLLDVESGIEYRRTTGGLAWPGNGRHGCLVVLGECRNTPNVLGLRREIKLLQEVHSDNTQKLVDSVVSLTSAFLVRSWATPGVDKRAWMLDDMNDMLRKQKKIPVRFGDPEEWTGRGEGLMSFYLALVERRTKGEKTLYFGKGSACSDEISKLGEKDLAGKPTDYPGAAALFFALAEIDVNPIADFRQGNTSLTGPADNLGGY